MTALDWHISIHNKVLICFTCPPEKENKHLLKNFSGDEGQKVM